MMVYRIWGQTRINQSLAHIKNPALKLHAHPAGTFFTEPANTPHFGMTKDEGAVLHFYGIGPSGRTPLEKEESGGK